MEKRKSFVFYAEWAEVLKDYAEDVRLEVYEAAIRYAVFGDIVELRPLASMAFGFIRRDIDRDAARYGEYVEKQRESGRKGGAPRGNQNARKTAQNNPAVEETTENNRNNPAVEKTTENNRNNPAVEKTTENNRNNPAVEKTTENNRNNPAVEKTTETSLNVDVDDDVDDLNPPPRRAREAEAGKDGSEEAFYAETAGNEIMRQQTCVNLHLGRAEYDSLLEEFRGEARAKGLRHSSAEDYRRHAYDWMRRHVGIARENERRGQGKVKENGNGERFNDNSARAIGAGAAAFAEFLRGA